MPRVTVVMPAYNAERFIDEAIQSIRGQTLGDWEMIIVNDGSTDETGRIANRLAAEDPRIRVIHQENAGQAAANNRAIPQARAEYIARMDADDVSLPERIGILCEYLNSHPDVVVAGTNAIICSTCGKERLYTRLPEADAAIRSTLFTRKENAFYNSSLMFRKSAWIACGGERPCFGHAHDLDLCLRLLTHGAARNLAKPTIHYRLHPAQVSTTATEQQAACALAAFLCADARGAGIAEPDYTRRLQPIDAETLHAAGVAKRDTDEAAISNIVGAHERLCVLGAVAAARSLRQAMSSRFIGTPAVSRFASARCTMFFNEGKAAKSRAGALTAWGSGARFLPAAIPWLAKRLCRAR